MRVSALVVLLGACGPATPPIPERPDAGPRPDAAPAPDAPPDAMPPDASAPDALVGNGETIYETEIIGSPSFRVVGWQHYETIMGFQPNDPAWIGAVSSVWPDHEYSAPHNVMGPDVAHAPPYDDEARAGVAAAGFDDGNIFHMSDWVAPMGLTLSAVVVPSEEAPVGLTFDGADLPMIDESLWPLTVDGDLLRNGVGADPDFDSTYPRADYFDLTDAVEGWSHMPLNFGESTIFIPGAPGEYLYIITLTDAFGNAVRTRIPFTILP